MRNKRGFLGLIAFLILSLAVIVLAIIIIFNQNIKDAVSLIFGFLSTNWIVLIALVLIIVFRDFVMKFLLMVLGFIRGILKV